MIAALPRALMGLMAGLWLLSSGAAEARDTPPRGELRIEASVDGKFRLDGELRITVVLTNAGGQDLMLPADPGWDQAGGLSIEITSASGDRRTASHPDEPMRGSVSLEGAPGVTLAPGHSLALFRSLPAEEVLSAPGDYRVQVIYSDAEGRRDRSETIQVTVER